jgi:hypothetical protein
MSIKNKLSHLISGHLPSFVRSDYPQFVEFLEAYYRFLEQPGNLHDVLLNTYEWRDIDVTLDEFIPKFKKQHAYDFPAETEISSRRLIKYISQYYEAKGSEKATEIFFRILFDTEIDVKYPGDNILRASDGKWVRKNYIKVDTTNLTSNNIFILEGKKIQLNYYISLPGDDEVRSIETSCLYVAQTSEPNIYILEVNLPDTYPFPEHSDLLNIVDVDIDEDGIDETIASLGTYDTKIFVVYNGEVYGRLTRQLVSVVSIDSYGSMFVVPDAYLAEEITGENGAIIRVNSIQDFDTELYFLEDYVEPGYVTAGDDNTLAGIRIIESGWKFTASTNTVIITFIPYDSAGANATVTFNTGLVYKAPGYFKDASGFLSDINKLFDNYYYQPYSYVISSDTPLDVWKQQYLQSTHPAGFKMFAELELSGDETIVPTVEGSIVAIDTTP